MNKILKYIYLLPILILVSCVYDEGLSIEDVLKVSDNTFEFTAAGDEIEFTIESYCGWEIKCEADWVSFSDYEGESKDVKNVLTVSENLSVNARTAQAEIINDRYGINIKLNISQEAGLPYIKTSSERLEFEEEGGVAEIKVESNVSWEASVNSEWIDISVISGDEGTNIFKVEVLNNKSVESRNGIITLNNKEYGLIVEVLISQSDFKPIISLTPEVIGKVSDIGITKELTIESNVTWEASADVDWIELSPQSGESGVTTMTINIDRNVSVDRRLAVISVVNSEYGIEEEISVVQSEFVPELKVNLEKLENISFDGSSEEVRIESNISWEASVDVDWIEISPKSGVSGVTTMKINVNKNTSLESRSSVIKIVNSVYDIEQEILVVQSEFVPELEVDREKIENISYNGSTGKIRIESNISWESSIDVDWIEISPKSGLSGVTTMTINVNKNTSVDSRSSEIKIVNSEYGIVQEILIVQSEFVPELEVNREKLENISFDGSSEEVRIESNISWEASVDVDWIEISPKSGLSGVTTMTINVNKNTSLESRSSVIRIVNSEYDIDEEILVVQSESVPKLEVNREKIEDISFYGSTEQITIESNISWKASVDVDWIEISPKSRLSGITTMTINVNKNTLLKSREGIITLKNEEYSLIVCVKIQQNKWVPNINGYEYVDLGLPSGLKWATCNVGASSPEEYGDYYAWGEIETKSEYTFLNCKTDGISDDISGNATYDVARAKWGGSWRLPTKKELEELESKCTWKWTTQNGKKGYKVTGPNGNSIFMPAAGCRDGSSLNFAGEYGFYRSSTPVNPYDVYVLYFCTDVQHVDLYDRFYGQSVRPVSE